MKSAATLFLTAALTQALHVIQWQDNMVLAKGSYIDLSNFNEATKLSEREPSISQQFIFNLTSNYQNYAFDVLVFPTDDDKPFNCYKLAISQLTYNHADCDFSKVQSFLNVQSYDASLQDIEALDLANKHIVIDNSPIPADGVHSGADLTTMLSVRTDFEMNYNIKTLTIYAGLLIISLVFALLGVMYIFCKTRSDYLAKSRKLANESDGQFGVLN